ncbi:MAG TPA: bifunctional histidinol-phosphatase/imidazoleglycerol-phosphate dehydratase HisB [Salinivirgaceae bacterium]|nr:bifunctional histidinol-phosphatase/imidazoleglycerol-phosphate dehydratase HisB [Salinivirgaceae bacterium]
MKPILFIDRDGTLIKEPSDFQIDSPDKLDFMPGVFSWLGRIRREFDYYLVMVTNQDGLGTPSFPEKNFWTPHDILIRALRSEGIEFDEVKIDKSFPNENLPTRKPSIAMVKHLLNGDFDIENSFVIGDRETDEIFAKNIGCRAIRFGAQATMQENLTAWNWKDVYDIVKPQRVATVYKKTNETDIVVRINLDGNGSSKINTGIAFFDHMLEQLAKHSGIDMEIRCTGDLEVDEHHTIEDVALALGDALKQAIGNKAGIARYGFALPMDESNALVMIDWSGRPYLVFKGKFTREYVGQMPTEMVKHFFHSLAYSALMTLHISFKGENDHHKVEAIFKCFAHCLASAIKKNGTVILSTKGLL